MHKASRALTPAVVLAVSLGVLAASTPTVQPSYEALMAMSSDERRAALMKLDEPARLAVFRTHIDHWLDQNRDRLSASQAALVTEVRNNLTPGRDDYEKMIALERRMRCELWRSDVIAVSLPHRDHMSSSVWQDLSYWFRECVVSKAIDIVF